jgi:ribonuclease Y
LLSTAALVVLAVVMAAAGVVLGRMVANRRAAVRLAGMRQLVEALRVSAAAESNEIRRGAELTAREEAQMAGAAFDGVAQVRETELSMREAQIEARRHTIGRLEAEVAERRKRMDVAQAGKKAWDEQARQAAAATAEKERERLAVLERRAGTSRDAVRAAIVDAEVEAARISAAQLLRGVDQSGADPDQTRRAKRVMGIAVGRFSGHYLTERLSSLVLVPPGLTLPQVSGPDEANLRAIETVANVKLAATEAGDGVRMEGLDGVGREVVRRTFTWMGRNARTVANPGAIGQAAREISATLDRELMDLGRRAFKALEIPRAHEQIVSLVGRLNYRTSFTQNQWKHAIEAAFLCGMMADELDLDVKVARRAALMHDIGKALTHELDGSHAVIGADYARRLGESEIVANAIGAHHTDEPFSSPYAYLVAAADAMSGARPGARRQMEDNYVARLGDLERITRGFKGVQEAFVVQGGREVRIYVADDQIDDVAAVGLSTEIARKISAEMTFPGQIRVTVIREMKAIEMAS